MPNCSKTGCKNPYIKQDIISLCFIDEGQLVCPTCATDELMLEIAMGAYKHNNGLERLNRQSQVLTRVKKQVKHLTRSSNNNLAGGAVRD